MTKKTAIHYGRPADRSLEAFKEFVNAMIAKLAPNAKRTMTEDDWKKYHTEFWASEEAKKE